MLFNSYIFILCFLPITFALYFVMRHFERNRSAKLALMGMSLWFYGYFNYRYLFIILFCIFVNYSLAFLMNKITPLGKWRNLLFVSGLIYNIGIIFYFKYYDFFISNMNHVFGSSFVLKNMVLPLGISFFTFQQISFLVDTYKNETESYAFIDFALFVCFFPHLIAGPIVMHKELIPQFNDKTKFRINYDNVAHGLYIFAIGLFKKMIIADTFGRAVTYGYSTIETLSSADVIIVMLSYTFQIYFDFSSYCDMAIGLAKMFNIDLPQNFNSPYKSKSVIEFWEKWHMTLTRFLKTYIYIPLGGSRKGKVRTYINIFIVFLISGLWHGANWTFIFWGMMHGIANIINKRFNKSWEKVNDILQWILTFTFINITWLFFRSESINQAFTLVKRIIGCGSTAIDVQLMNQFMIPEINLIAGLSFVSSIFAHINGLSMWMFLIGALIIVLNFKNINEIKFKCTVGRAAITIVFFVWSIVSFAGVSTFLYFNF